MKLSLSTVPPSDDKETEWKDEMDEAGTCPGLLREGSPFSGG